MASAGILVYKIIGDHVYILCGQNSGWFGKYPNAPNRNLLRFNAMTFALDGSAAPGGCAYNSDIHSLDGRATSSCLQKITDAQIRKYIQNMHGVQAIPGIPANANLNVIIPEPAADNNWGNGTDPATTLDVSGLTQQENAVAVYWIVPAAITLDSVTALVACDDSDAATINVHLFSYDMDDSPAGDLSGGTVHASGATTCTCLLYTSDAADE